ncbi:sigma-70 family RNA polymerase sigma factor [Pseudomonas sp. B21-031]|uniref:sigma-70 family RNA polymerase sigma factor n=1 Tax=Pseudomonas sp. B21-031 TaxID=2895482 RepID=UPI00215F7A4B|nr:sigma-70 family RNA polymerase sigma factor [Pseudomonas sp. B21-031]UVL64836.1 sigma-70 family RNA polymerase sigma factor [Pseudomonas sp. B21-031]
MSTMPPDAVPHEQLHALYRDHNVWLRSWLRHRLNNSADAADLAQDTFVRVLLARTASSLKEPRHYLTTIARGLVIDLYRRRSLEQAYLEALQLRPEAYAPSAEIRAQILDSLLAIDRLLDGLGTRTRQIFLAVQLDGLSYEKTAERCGVSVSTVRKHLARGLMHCLLLNEA